MSVTATWLCQTCLLTRGLPARCVSRPGAAAQLPVACRQRRNVIATAATATGPGGSAEEPMDMMASFQQELLRREASAAAAQERETAYQFDGEALLQMLLDRYDRSYDVTLVRREYLGRSFVAMNIMWSYAEQKSFGLSQEEHMNRLDYVAAALRQWGVVSKVKEAINSRKDRPRVGKAVSIMLELDEEVARDWFGSSS
mmetsp:Transcript_1650/g.4806  ORF Transcript_1650/g.4806 Transcript_1650/m.4806 type:complete len:199 (+) Transcript_1650:195-791(+)